MLVLFDSPHKPGLHVMPLDNHLSQDEIDELDGLLTSDAVSDDCMDVATLHGFLTALAIGPSLVLPSEWLPVVWGEDEDLVFESLDEARGISGLIMRLSNSVLGTLREAPNRFLPIVYQEETAEGKLELQPEAWCEGFVEGMRLRTKDWEPLFQDEMNIGLPAPILAFADQQTMAELLASDVGLKPSRVQLLALIPLGVAGIYDYWRSQRKRGTGMRSDEVRGGRGSKVGRNEPCPCGSGKKFKKCCGASAD